VIDTGIYTQHAEFEGRAKFVMNFDKSDGSDTDMSGHGTHVAGIIGSKTYGVAKKTSLFAIKACNQFGICQLSDVIAALTLVVSDSKKRSCRNGVVVNMSLGASNTDWMSIQEVIREVIQAGIFVAVAAGNDEANAASSSPASSPGACVVGASNGNDTMAFFSNFGPLVSVFAPGAEVLSTWNRAGATVRSRPELVALDSVR
jgi:subtilisin family serine protease